MLSAERVAKVLDDYQALLEARRTRGLSLGEEQRLELLRDVVLEAGCVLEAGADSRRRAPRTDARLEVAFSTATELASSYTRDLGTGGLSLQTPTPLAVGSVLRLRISLPGLAEPLDSEGEVVWARDGAAGLAFRAPSPKLQEEVKRIVTESQSFLERFRATLRGRGGAPLVLARWSEIGEDRGAPAPGSPPTGTGRRTQPPLPPAHGATTRPGLARLGVLVRLSEKALEAAVIDLLELHGVCAAVALPKSIRVRAIVADAVGARSAVESHPGVPVVFANVSGPDALVGKLATLQRARFVPRPAPAQALIDAVEEALGRRGPSAG